MAGEDEVFFPPDVQQEIRLGFILKTYSLLSVQLAFTTVVVAVTYADPALQAQLVNWIEGFILAVSLSSATLVLLVLCPACSRKVPVNYCMFVVFTLAEAGLVAYVCALTEPGTILVGSGLTLGMEIVLTVFAGCQRKKFSFAKGSFMIVLYTAGCACACGAIYVYHPSFFLKMVRCRQVYCSCFALSFGIYVLANTYSLTSSDQIFTTMIDDYVLGALMLYVHLMLLFTLLLKGAIIAACIIFRDDVMIWMCEGARHVCACVENCNCSCCD